MIPVAKPPHPSVTKAAHRLGFSPEPEAGWEGLAYRLDVPDPRHPQDGRFLVYLPGPHAWATARRFAVVEGAYPGATHQARKGHKRLFDGLRDVVLFDPRRLGAQEAHDELLNACIDGVPGVARTLTPTPWGFDLDFRLGPIDSPFYLLPKAAQPSQHTLPLTPGLRFLAAPPRADASDLPRWVLFEVAAPPYDGMSPDARRAHAHAMHQRRPLALQLQTFPTPPHMTLYLHGGPHGHTTHLSSPQPAPARPRRRA